MGSIKVMTCYFHNYIIASYVALATITSYINKLCIYIISGQQYDKYGDRVKWWTDQSIQNFQQRTQCFVKQYDQYTLLGLRVGGYY